MPPEQLDVVVGVLCDTGTRVLLGRRPEGKPLSGYLDFPGGKIEAGEQPGQALIRELREELAIDTDPADLEPVIRFSHAYPQAKVRLHAYLVRRWVGEPIGAEGQSIGWYSLDALPQLPLLPADRPLLNALALPHRLRVTPLITHANVETIAERLKIGLRQPGESGVILRLDNSDSLGAVQALLGDDIREASRPVLLNAADVTNPPKGYAGLHLPAKILMKLDRRPRVTGWVGASVHTIEEALQAHALELDYVLAGNIRETPSHPGRTGLGWQGFSELASTAGLPAYAIGGVGPEDLSRARVHWGQGVAGIRAFWPGTA